MKRIALYGYGYYGKRTSESFRLYWGGAFEVTAIFDEKLAGEKDPYWGLDVLPPEKLREEFDRGTFEAVMVCINMPALRGSLKEKLESMGIPLFLPGSVEDIADPEDFQQEEKPEIRVSRKGYSFHVYQKMLGAVPDFDRTYMFFLFDESGRINFNNYRKYQHDFREMICSYPFRLKDPVPERIYMKGDYCVISKSYCFNYWHFTFEIADGVYLLEQAGFRGKYIYKELSYIRELLLILGVTPDRLIPSRSLEIHRVYEFERLFDINHSGFAPMECSREVLPEMAAFVQRKLTRDEKSPKRIYLKRIGVRKLLNDDDIFIKNGFSVIIPENYSVLEQMNLFYNADIVIGAHGANCTNYLYMRKGTVFVEISSDRWKMDIFRGVSEACGVRYLKIEGKTDEAGLDNREVDFRVDEEVLQKAICEAEAMVS